MTAAQALARLEALPLRDDPKLAEALDVLRARVTPKPRKPRAKEWLDLPPAARALKACSDISPGVNQYTAYLDTFGEPGSPERDAQAERVKSLPVYAQFAYEGMKQTQLKDVAAARVFLWARLDQFKRDDEQAARDRAREVAIKRVRLECEALRRMADRFGGKVYGNAWPSYRYGSPLDTDRLGPGRARRRFERDLDKRRQVA